MVVRKKSAKKSAALKGAPVPSGSMYIGLCTTRAQSANLRWQKAIVFMALNGVIGGWCIQLFKFGQADSLFAIACIAAVMFFANLLFRGLVRRANQWIDYFTIAIEKIELKYGTETGVLVFSDPLYLAKQAAEPLVKGFRFRKGITTLSDTMIAIWGGMFLISLVWAAYSAGHGGW